MKPHKWIDYKRDGILGSIPIRNEVRDKEWTKLVKSKEAKSTFGKEFPVDHTLYNMFCIAWELGWQDAWIRKDTNETT